MTSDKALVFAVAVATACIAGVPVVNAGLIADLANDWSDTNNSNTTSFGTWSYRQGSSLLPGVSNFTFAGTESFPSPQPAWAPSNDRGNFLPAEFKLRSVPNDLDAKVGDVLVHTTDGANGSASGPANFMWTSSINGTVSISGDVWAAATLSGRDNQWALLVNGVVVSSGTNIDSYTSANRFLFSNGTGGSAALVQNVTIGSTIVLQITRTSDERDPGGYFVGTELTITDISPLPVPEPSTIALMGLGGIVLTIGAYQRRRMSAV